MVRGLGYFRDYFKDFQDSYILIGGVACDLAMEQAGPGFRATKDLDIVLCAEAIDEKFIAKFWEFVKEGSYEHQEKSTGDKQFYRFNTPSNDQYPFMLELFSRKLNDMTLEDDSHLTPIPVDADVLSLSAILLDDDYYECIEKGKTIIDGVPVLGAEYILPFKARAWFDLTKRKASGAKVDSKDILQVTDELNGASQELQDLVAYATHPDVGSRLILVDEFLEYLDLVEDELTRPESQLVTDPTKAREGDTFEGGITVLKRLGKGACSVVFLIKQNNKERVLKVAITQEHNKHIAQEGETLANLRHQAIVAHYATLDIAGHTSLIIDYASSGTLSQRLRANGAIQLELLERFGDDLMSAVAHIEDKGVVHRDIKPENIGLVQQASVGQLHLVLFDFSLSNVGTDNITAGTVAYVDPFLRDAGRRRWDDFAERFSAALTLYEMAAGTLPSWASTEGLPHVIQGELEIDGSVFDPAVREKMTRFFKTSLARDVKNRFSNAEEMLKAWRQIYVEASQASTHPTAHDRDDLCPIEEAQLDTQIGLLELSPQALDTLSRRNINTVKDLIKVNRNQVRVWPGVGVKTRTELSDVISKLQTRLITEHNLPVVEAGDERAMSLDKLISVLVPKVTKATDEKKHRVLTEYLGRLDEIKPSADTQLIHWPSISKLSAHVGIDSAEARETCLKLVSQWSKLGPINSLREEIVELLQENGGVMTAIEIADAILLRRGSIQQSPTRERWAQAVVRAAIEAENSKQGSRCIMRRSGNRFLIADNRDTFGEELADYARDLGEIADECANEEPLLSPLARPSK